MEVPPFVWPALAWLIGVALGDRWAWSPLVWLGPVPVLVTTATWRVYAVRRTLWGRLVMLNPLSDRLFLMTLAGLALLLGGFRAAQARPSAATATLAAFNDLGEPVIVEGVVVNDPEVHAARQRLRVTADHLTPPDGTALPVEGDLVVRVPLYPAFAYGDRVRLTGLLETPPTFEGFDYRAYLARQGIFSQMRRAEVEIVARGRGHLFYRLLYGFRRHAARTIGLILPEPHAALLNGILLGIEGGIPDEVMEYFNATGTTHILVISGFNISILAGLFLAIGRRLLSPRGATAFAVGGVLLYTLLVGADAAVTRAAIMGVLYILARQWGRRTLALNSLAVAAVVMTLWRPGMLHDVGFQLSALATLALILFVPDLSAWVEARLPVRGPYRRRVLDLLNEAFVVTLAAQLLTTPLIVYVFGRLSLVSLLANLLILPVQAWVMLGGGVAALAGLAWLPLGRLLAWVPWAGLAWTLAVVERAARLPYAQVEVAPFGPEGLAAVYGLVLGGWWLARHPKRQMFWTWLRSRQGQLKAAGWVTLAVAALAPWVVLQHAPDRYLHILFLDVGQGDAVLIEGPDGKQVLVDGGPDPQVLLARLGQELPPWDRTLDLVVTTHPDADHLGGLPEVLARYEVSTILDPELPAETALSQTWVAARQAEGAQVVRAVQGQVFDLGHGAQLEVIWPPPQRPADDNNSSIVLRVRYGRFCALLTADVEVEVEEQLAASGALTPCAVLKVAHHGSSTSTSPALVKSVRPAVAVISVGENRFGHPDEGVLARLEGAGAKVFRTDRGGTVELISDGEEVWVHTAR